MHNVLLIYLILEHTEAEKEDEPALRTPTPESDEPTEGNAFIYIDELYLYVKNIKVRMPVKMCKNTSNSWAIDITASYCIVHVFCKL